MAGRQIQPRGPGAHDGSFDYGRIQGRAADLTGLRRPSASASTSRGAFDHLGNGDYVVDALRRGAIVPKKGAEVTASGNEVVVSKNGSLDY